MPVVAHRATLMLVDVLLLRVGAEIVPGSFGGASVINGVLISLATHTRFPFGFF